MLFEIQKNGLIEAHRSSWKPKELELEQYIISSSDSDAQILEPSIFGEPLLLISNQVRTRSKKRADILGLDRGGNGVIIELKRDAGTNRRCGWRNNIHAAMGMWKSPLQCDVHE